MITSLIRQLGEDVGVVLPEVRVTGDDPVFASVFRVDTAAAASVGAATAAVAAYWKRRGGAPAVDPDVSVDVRHAAAAFQSERHFRMDGKPAVLWAPLSGDYRTSDGWIKLHCNFDHHRDAALRALGLAAGAVRDDVAAACAGRTGIDIEEAVTREGGCGATMRTRREWLAHPQGRAVAELPLVGLSRLTVSAAPAPGEGGEAAAGGPPEPVHGPRPLSGVRVLDLTRVIAGPVAARFLAAHGAEVLRVGAAHLPEVPGLVVETAFGKRSCHIDLTSEPEVLRDLVRRADVVIQAYRPGALRERGFGPEDLAALRPGIVCVDVSAYGSRGPWASRRGFDSLVQMVSGIAHENGDGSRPVPLPAQALDHATGFLAAFGAVAGLLRRTDEGGSWLAEVALARTAAWLDGLGRSAGDAPEPRVDDLLAGVDSAFGALTYVRPPGRIQGAEPYWASAPPVPGGHHAGWETTTGTG
ncbi:CoA transferase [Planotetraspora kaengkrachanensis]|uniref:CoA transferase n=1 Tax=Planotetraspora kaengkrachanensis TaxID=575193 RepID=A0A8J3Q0N0_9ACTN|nr:CoA transferase [Planotetraspora kaengkrachanensis]GIG84428.1 CoA transferase [Planotetraspora kaengkrachanensis]